jgi:hypothetical protein
MKVCVTRGLNPEYYQMLAQTAVVARLQEKS